MQRSSSSHSLTGSSRILHRRLENPFGRLVQLTVVGEAVKRLSDEFRSKHPFIPWGLMTGMRDHLVHGYDLVDWDEVWKTATSDRT